MNSPLKSEVMLFKGLYRLCLSQSEENVFDSCCKVCLSSQRGFATLPG